MRPHAAHGSKRGTQRALVGPGDRMHLRGMKMKGSQKKWDKIVKFPTPYTPAKQNHGSHLMALVITVVTSGSSADDLVGA